jgi:hypothetical protein
LTTVDQHPGFSDATAAYAMEEYAMNKELFSQKVVVPESILVRELSGEAVLLSLESEMYFGLDEIGYRMWTLLTTSDSVGAAYEQLLTEYEVEPEELWESLDTLIAQCKDKGLLQLIPQK